MANLEKIEYVKKHKPFGISDIIIFSLVIIIVVLSVIFIYSPKGEKVEINYNGQKKYVSLLSDKEIDLDGKLTVVIKDKSCHVINSLCPDKVCEHMGKIRFSNQIIACAPQNIIIKIVDGKANGVISGAKVYLDEKDKAVWLY